MRKLRHLLGVWQSQMHLLGTQMTKTWALLSLTAFWEGRVMEGGPGYFVPPSEVIGPQGKCHFHCANGRLDRTPVS